MKANEFVKKFGWEKSKMAVKKLLPMEDGMPVFDYNSEDLKRLVESYDLIIKDFESIEMAEYEYMVSASYSDPYWVRVKQAIADVESCL